MIGSVIQILEVLQDKNWISIPNSVIGVIASYWTILAMKTKETKTAQRAFILVLVQGFGNILIAFIYYGLKSRNTKIREQGESNNMALPPSVLLFFGYYFAVHVYGTYQVKEALKEGDQFYNVDNNAADQSSVSVV